MRPVSVAFRHFRLVIPSFCNCRSHRRPPCLLRACSVPAAGGIVSHKLTNGGTDRLVFKVKSSNNNEYRVKPVFGFVEPSATADLEVTRTAGAPKEDKLVVEFAVVPADAADAAAAFKAATPAGNFTIPLTAQ